VHNDTHEVCGSMGLVTVMSLWLIYNDFTVLQLSNKTRDSHKNLFICTAHAYINDINYNTKNNTVYTVQ